VLFFLIAFLGLLVYLNSPPSFQVKVGEGVFPEDENAVLLEVQKGESAQSVGRRLEGAGLIRSRYFWLILCRVRPEFIKSGSYRLEIPASQMAIHGVLRSGRQLLSRVTHPEGVNMKKTARILENSGICSADSFLEAASDRELLAMYRIPGRTMEGYLFPDTYLFPSDYPAHKVVQTMADNFFDRIGRIEPGAQNLSPAEINRRVIIASIVEREYRVEKEAPLMAGVFFNRLDIGMALQSCATEEYVSTEIQGRPHPELLYTRDTEIPDPYNTYVRSGLPPGPISAPGAAALDAAFHPADCDYLYFRLRDPEQGIHYFSRTLDDHIQAGLLYVKRQS
jgi:UPF0755 protein